MSKLFQYNVQCILIFLIISITYTPGYSSSAIQLEKEVVIDSPAIGTANLPDKMTFRLYDSAAAAAPIASQSFYRGGYSAYYNIAKSDGLTQKSIVRLSVEFTDLSQLGSNVDALSNLWLEVEIDGRPVGEREPLNKEATKQILSLATAQDTGGPDALQNVTKQVSGTDGQIQYNNGGVEGGAGQFYYDDVNHRVGIGTAGPGQALDVNGAIRSRTGMFQLNNGTTTGGGLYFHKTVTGAGTDLSPVLFAETGKKLYFATNGEVENWDMVIDTSGNVGIGTTNPWTKLHVSGDGAGVRLTGRTYTSATIFDGGTGDPGYFRAYYNGDIDAQLGANATYFAALGGNVGIGTTSPCADCKLAVNGKIRAKSVVVDTGWSDFVFRDSYTLMPLRELERFIKNNRHLPGIPTEADVKENGISVGDISAKLLQKIEELTLYVIELKKENEALQKQLGKWAR